MKSFNCICSQAIFGTTMNVKSSKAYVIEFLYKVLISTLRVKLLIKVFIFIFLVFIKHVGKNDLDGTQFLFAKLS